MPSREFFPRGIVVRGPVIIDGVGTIATSSGINSVGDINISSGGVDLAVNNASSGTNLDSFGWHYSSGTTATFLLDNPEPGREVSFTSISGATGTTYTIVVETTSVNIATSSGGQNGRQVALNGAAGVRLLGLTSGLYVSVGQYGNVVYSSST